MLMTSTTEFLTATCKFLKQGYDKLNFVKHFLNSTTVLIVKYNVDLKTLLQQGISESIFYGDLVYNSKNRWKA